MSYAQDRAACIVEKNLGSVIHTFAPEADETARRALAHYRAIRSARIQAASKALRFVWNGIKSPTSGKLCPGHWRFDRRANGAPYVTFYAREYEGVPLEVRAAFQVENNTDTQTDYFERDSFRLDALHPLWKQALEACVSVVNHSEKRKVKWAAKAYGEGKQPVDYLSSYKASRTEMDALLAAPATIAMAAGA